MTVIDKLEKMYAKFLNVASITVRKKYNPVLQQDEYCVTGADGYETELFLGRTFKEASAHINDMSSG